MSAEKRDKVVDFAFGRKVVESLKKYSYKDFLTGNIFERFLVGDNLVFLLVCVGLVVLNISNHYGVERLLRENDQLLRELDNTEQEAITTSSELMFISKRSQVHKRVDELNINLVPLSEPPRTFKLD